MANLVFLNILYFINRFWLEMIDMCIAIFTQCNDKLLIIAKVYEGYLIGMICITQKEIIMYIIVDNATLLA